MLTTQKIISQHETVFGRVWLFKIIFNNNA